MAAADFVQDLPGLHTSSGETDLIGTSDATEEQVIFRAPFRCRVQSVICSFDRAVGAHYGNVL